MTKKTRGRFFCPAIKGNPRQKNRPLITSAEYFLKPGLSSFLLDSAIGHILDNFTKTKWGTFYFMVKLLNVIQSDAEKKAVIDAGKVGYVLAVESLSTAESGTVVLGWYNYPYAEIDLSQYEVEQWEAGK